MGGCVLRGDPGFPARGHVVPAANHPHVHRLVLLGLSRQGARRPWLSLTGCLAPHHPHYSAGVAEPSAIGTGALRARALAFSGPSDRRCQSALIDGSRKRVKNVATDRPPMMVKAIGPQKALCESGIIARIAASAVSATGRARRMVEN